MTPISFLLSFALLLLVALDAFEKKEIDAKKRRCRRTKKEEKFESTDFGLFSSAFNWQDIHHSGLCTNVQSRRLIFFPF